MTALKWALFAVAVLASYPVALWLRERPGVRLPLWTLVGLLPFIHPEPMALVFFGGRPSDTHGVEVAFIDWLALCLLLAARAGRRLPSAYRLALSAYFLVVIVSISQARWPELAAAHLWKLCRMALVLVAVWRAGVEDARVPVALLRGMAIGAVYEGGLAAWQHFGRGVLRAQGSFSGWNSLGVVLNLVAMVPVARILAGPTSLLTKLVPLAAVAGALFSVSRGALLFLGVGIALVWIGSTLRRPTARKAWFGACGLLLFAAVVPVALSALASRTAEERQESLDTRARLETAAVTMLREHPLGVGASHYVPELLLGGYGERAGLGWRMWVAVVHNVYWLTAAELGHAGVVALLLLFLAPLRLALLRRAGGPRGDVLLGLGAGLAVFGVHSCFEWVWRLNEIMYLWFMNVGVVAVLAAQAQPAPASGMRRPGYLTSAARAAAG